MADSLDEPTSHHQPPHIHRPVPRRAFDPRALHDSADSPTHSFSHPAHSPTAASLQSSRSSDFLAQLNARLLRTYNAREDAPESPVEGGAARLPRQNKSFLNMNSSTLFGIYDDVGASTHGAASVAETPWGTGAETPRHTGGLAWAAGVDEGAADGVTMAASAQRGGGGSSGKARPSRARRGSQTRRPRSGSARYAVLAAKLVALFTFGVFYGTIVSHLHDTRQLAAVHVKGVDRKSWFYVTTWGCAGVALGSLLPYVDLLWRRHSKHCDADADADADVPVSEQINDVVRSVAAFVGVAFAIANPPQRRLPWQSTLQLTLTLALVNPALWYILDRSKPGLSLSLLVTSLLTSLMFLSNPTALPSPTHATAGANATREWGKGERGHLFAGVISYESLAVVTWVGSVLFCSCVCFGSIGRRLAVLEKS
ncbi:insig domain-containing protein [Stagonosporopsis vannaccii]|nr:insig domain-containing protein [Stagonosporopsis vannaccii]